MIKLYDLYKTKLVFKLMKKFGYTSIMQVPIITKIVINMGLGEIVLNKKILNNALFDLTLISGQKPVITKVKKSVASFKIRKGNVIGCKVTLRGKRMWFFFDKLISIVIPRIRDFRGMSLKSFDGFGNYNLGIREQIIFPEIDYNNIDLIRGLDISFVTNTKSDYEARIFFKACGFPFNYS